MSDDLDRALQHARNVGLDDRHIAGAVVAAANAEQERQRAEGVVVLVHPDLPGQPYTVPPESVEGYASSGWQVAQPELEPPPALVDVELLPEQEPAEDESEET